MARGRARPAHKSLWPQQPHIPEEKEQAASQACPEITSSQSAHLNPNLQQPRPILSSLEFLLQLSSSVESLWTGSSLINLQRLF